MCRHWAYVGAATSPAWPMLDAPHSLRVQSYAPRDMRCGAVANADGFGLGWYADGRPQRYRRDCPLWSDQGIDAVARSIRSTAFLAAARSATTGMPVMETACAPFNDEKWLFSHNGVVPGWPDSVVSLASTLSTVDLMTLPAPTDSALLWALLRVRLLDGQDPGEAIAALTEDVLALAPDAKLNFLLTDGTRIWASTVVHSLSYRPVPGGVLLASEPVDAPADWISVGDRMLVVADAEDLTCTPLSKVGLS